MNHDGILYCLQELGVSITTDDLPEPTSKDVVKAICAANDLRFYDTGENYCLPAEQMVCAMYPNPDTPNVDAAFYVPMSQVDVSRLSGLIAKA